MHMPSFLINAHATCDKVLKYLLQAKMAKRKKTTDGCTPGQSSLTSFGFSTSKRIELEGSYYLICTHGYYLTHDCMLVSH